MGLLSLLTRKTKTEVVLPQETEIYRQNPDLLENDAIQNHTPCEQVRVGHTEGSGIMNPRQMRAALAEMSSHTHPLTKSSFQRRSSTTSEHSRRSRPRVVKGQPAALRLLVAR